jgi:hypothetical protein
MQIKKHFKVREDPTVLVIPKAVQGQGEVQHHHSQDANI